MAREGEEKPPTTGQQEQRLWLNKVEILQLDIHCLPDEPYLSNNPTSISIISYWTDGCSQDWGNNANQCLRTLVQSLKGCLIQACSSTCYSVFTNIHAEWVSLHMDVWRMGLFHTTPHIHVQTRTFVCEQGCSLFAIGHLCFFIIIPLSEAFVVHSRCRPRWSSTNQK